MVYLSSWAETNGGDIVSNLCRRRTPGEKTPEVAIRAAEGAGGQKRAVARNWSRFTVSVNSASAGWVAGGDTLRVPRRHAWVPSARRSEAVDQAPRPSVSPSGSGLIAAERDGLHLSRNGSSVPSLLHRLRRVRAPSARHNSGPVSQFVSQP